MGLRLNAILVALFLIISYGANGLQQKGRNKRGIDLSASYSLISDKRLPADIVPRSYEIDLRPSIETGTFEGIAKINISWTAESQEILLHAHYDLSIEPSDIRIRILKHDRENGNDSSSQQIGILRAERDPKKPIYQIYLKRALKKGDECELEISFRGTIWETVEGLFKGSYLDDDSERRSYLATSMRPNNARRLFPCFDEPGFKVPFAISISRPKTYTTIFNTPVERTEPLKDSPDYVVDHFEKTSPMSSFSFGFVISQLEEVPNNSSLTIPNPIIKIWARSDLKENLQENYEKIASLYRYFENYFKIPLPLKKLDFVAIPMLPSVRPIDNWGVILFKESEFMKKGYYTLAQELVYQWLGTPNWWNDVPVNKALASFLAAEAVLNNINQGTEFNGKYPMTMTYSIYYEFSKRYPHSRITGMKHETTSFKTELVLRMLNFTLGSEAFEAGVRDFIAKRSLGTFVADGLWNALGLKAHEKKTLSETISVERIASSWLSKDRLPAVTIIRNYKEKSAVVSQKVFLRERPHDVPDQDKMLWWIPLTLVTQSKLDFTESKPKLWMEETRETKLYNLPDENEFIILNPEEWGPFPVNYDQTNWNKLSEFLQTDKGRTQIPTYTRAKLLHDAWNLAYAGDLSFATAFNMTLFMLSERNHVVWNPVFTFIDHIGRHIDMSAVHKKFEAYVRIILTPLYEELGQPDENEDSWKTDLRTLAKTFLCRAGYSPCITEAQAAFKKWMDSDNPEEGNPVPNQFICPVFKCGTPEEWEFGLQRIINFPQSRTPSERTYLLKTLAGCPAQEDKIERLLNITILEENANFSENDISLIFSMLTGGSNGYVTLFKFLSNNWKDLKKRFENKTNLWDNLIGSATGSFTTQQGYEMVSKLYTEHRGEFGSAEHIIEKSRKNIKEEAKWSNENLPVIEKWLDTFLKTHHI